MKNKITGLVFLLGITLLSGALLNKFLNWAEEVEAFDFDLSEDIDFIEPPD